jgi:hypothetical protein
MAKDSSIQSQRSACLVVQLASQAHHVTSRLQRLLCHQS